MAPALSTSSPRNHVADANPDLARKKQRLSEDPGTSGDDPVIIELCEPEDEGTSTYNAIEIEDEGSINMAPYSEIFVISKEPCSTFEQLGRLLNNLNQNCYIDPHTFINLARALDRHIERTADEPDQWKRHYFGNDSEFFNRLALVAINLLDGGDLFQPSEDLDTPVMRNALHVLLAGLEALCRRIVPCLSDSIKVTLARRDSAQVSTRHVGALPYIVVAHRVLAAHSRTVAHFRTHGGRVKLDGIIQRNREMFFTDTIVTSLAILIKKLTGVMREVKESWLALQHALKVFQIAITEHISNAKYPTTESEAIMEIVCTFILPAICEKHPRALPDGFHMDLISFGASVLFSQIRLHDQASAWLLYERFVKGQNDGVLPGAEEDIDNTSTLGTICGEDQEVVARLLQASWSFQAAKRFLCSEIMDIRNLGIISLKDQLVQIYRSEKDGVQGFDHPVVQYAVRFLKQNEITAYIFGPESRAGLVQHSSDIVCFLAVTSTYTDIETDTIWHACSTSVEADFVKASFFVLVSLLQYLDAERLLHLAKKYSSTDIGKLGQHAIEFLPKLFQELEVKGFNRSHPLEVAFTSIDILKHANGADRTVMVDHLRQAMLAVLERFTRSDIPAEVRTAIYKHCIPEIRTKSWHATTAVEILSLFLNGPITPDEAQDILVLLPVDVAVDELCHYVRSSKQSDSTHSSIVGFIKRLDCIIRLMGLSDFGIDQRTEDLLFAHGFGESALDNEARNVAWDQLHTIATANTLPSAASSLWHRFIHDRVPTLANSLITPKLVEFIYGSLKAECLKESTKLEPDEMLESPLWLSLVGFATTSSDSGIVAISTSAIVELLFIYPVTIGVPINAIVQIQAKFVQGHIEALRHIYTGIMQTEEVTSGTQTFVQGMNLLTAVLVKSRETASTYAAARPSDLLSLDDSDGSANTITFTAQIYGPESQAQPFVIRARHDTKVSALVAGLSTFTGAAENRVIAGGIEISHAPTKSLRDVGVQQSGVIMICPRYDFNLDLDTVLTRPGPIEQEILVQYDKLEAMLEGPEQLSRTVRKIIVLCIHLQR